MKKFKLIFAILTVTLLVTACESYDDFASSEKLIAGFTTKDKNINNIPIGGERSTTIDLFMTDVFDVDKTFNIIAIPALNEPATAPENYEFDATVTFLANTRTASITVTGRDVSIEDPEGEYFALAVEGDANVVSGGFASIRVRKQK